MNDHFEAEAHLLDFTEAVYQLHGEYKGIYLLYLRILEWLATRLIYRGRI